MAQAVSRRPLTVAARVRAQINPVGFVVDNVALGQVFLRPLRFSPVSIIPPWAPWDPHFRKLKEIHSHFSSFQPISVPSGYVQKSRESGRSTVRRQSPPHDLNTEHKLPIFYCFKSATLMLRFRVGLLLLTVATLNISTMTLFRVSWRLTDTIHLPHPLLC
jgi:hypothetical protein